MLIQHGINKIYFDPYFFLPEKHGIFFVKLILSICDKSIKQPLPQSCSYKAWERHHDSLIGMCGCTKIRCFVRLKTPRKLLDKLSATNTELKYIPNLYLVYKCIYYILQKYISAILRDSSNTKYMPLKKSRIMGLYTTQVNDKKTYYLHKHNMTISEAENVMS